MTLSVVIPVLDAGADLKACFDRLSQADEIIVVDGGSTDGSAQIARSAGARLVSTSAGRGDQLAAGAREARGDWLLFIHADTMLAPGWREAAGRHMAEHARDAACFRFALDDPSWQARLLERAVALRVRWLKLPYGDQGLLVSRSHYDAMGGYRSLPLMEDVDLVRRIGRHRLRVLDVPAVTSARRWRSDGWWRRSARNLACLALYAIGVSPARIARLYG